MSTWFITGATGGLGLAIARRALDTGHAVVATGRSVDRAAALLEGDGSRVLLQRMDVTDAESVDAAVRAAVERFGGIDVLVNNAGRGMTGAVEEVSDAETRAVFETNVFGVLAVTRAVLPGMRARRAGRILMVSSFGGFTQPGAGSGIYGSSKFALEGLSEALRNEVGPLGISVTIVEPGSFRTDFLASGTMSVAATPIEDYAALLDPVRERITAVSGTQRGDPARAAAAIVHLVDAGIDEARLPLGPDAVAAIEAKLAQVAENLRAVAGLSASTDHDVGGGGAA
jgi:NAD(P)-dependent dehydrogenase (short-subunit alcohol dehydrogenase family)